jgi:hypothetical protein
MITYKRTRPDGTVTTVYQDKPGDPSLILAGGAAAVSAEEALAAQGRVAWKTLHAAALAGTVTEEWLTTTFLPLVPRFGCPCRQEWQQILARYPLRPTDQFAWSVDVHNAVNTKLAKPVLTVEQARLVLPDLADAPGQA